MDDTQTGAFRADIATAASFQAALVNAETGVRGYVLSGRPDYLDPYRAGTRIIDSLARGLLPKVAASGDTQQLAHEPPRTISSTLAALQASWEAVIRLSADNQREQAAVTLLASNAKPLMDLLRSDVTDFVDERAAEAKRWDTWAVRVQTVIHVVNLGGAIFAAIAMIYAFRRITRAVAAGFEAREHTERLFSMTDMLQSAADQDDTNEVLRATAAELLPGLGGALYVFNNSRDRLDLSTHWGATGQDSAAHLVPTSCWALKRGKPHLNHLAEGALRCRHAGTDGTTLEIPMAARGELYGLLEIRAQGMDGSARLAAVQPIASAIADAMSLALSSLALRERLRNQALRDPLTGLYNRRFLEEMLGRMCLDAERRQTSIAAVMIDLDHFKKLNDQHGHGAGDAVLRDAASAVLSCLRTTDVACRYGGEELAVLLPDCTMALATGKAEQIRSRISELTAAAGLAVTASLGVAAIPESASGSTDLLANADAALYHAKQQGRDQVSVAPPRSATPRLDRIDTELVGATSRSIHSG